MGVSEKTIRNWEGGSNYPSDIHLEKLVELYLDRAVFPSGHEQRDVHERWKQMRELIPQRSGLFDEQWFARVLKERQIGSVNSLEPVSDVLLAKRSAGSRSAEQESASSPSVSSHLSQNSWSGIPDASVFYGRDDELNKLERWLLVDHCRLVAVLGMGGIGKTTLAVRLMQQVAPSFDCVLWRSLHNAPTLEEVLHDWLLILTEPSDIDLPQGVDQKLSLLLDLLRRRRCLLILDNLETLFLEGQLEGRYRAGYEAYAMLIRRLAETAHQSCLLLTCREKFPDLSVWNGRQAPVRVLRLAGLSAPSGQQLLTDKGLFGEQAAWSELVQRYSGNPLALKIVGEMVHELFGGNIAAFLGLGVTTFHGVRHLLAQQFERLSRLEQALLYWLAIEREWVPLATLEKDLQPPASASAVLEAMHALSSRSLVERGEREAAFTLQPMVLEYVTERLVSLVSQEIQAGAPALLLAHALLQGQARDYIRNSQRHFLIRPVLDRLLSNLDNPRLLEEHLELLLRHLRTLPRAIQRYGGGNVVNLLIQLNGHANGRDFSDLMIWQADLQGIAAQDTSFAGADLTGSAFLEAMDSILSVAFSSDGQLIAAGMNNGQIRLWRALDGQPLLTFQAHNRQIWSLVFNPENTLLVSGGNDGQVKVWEMSSGACVRLLRGHTTWVECVAMHPEGRLLATCGDERSIKLWDITTGDCLKTWSRQHNEVVWSVAFSPDGQLLASGYDDGVVEVWDYAHEHCLWSAAAHQGSAVPGLAFSADGKLLASAGKDATIAVWQPDTGQNLEIFSGHTDSVRSVNFNTDGLLVSSSYDGTVKVWQIGSEKGAGRCVDTLRGHTGIVWSSAVGPAELLISGGHDGAVKLWQIRKNGEGGTCLRTLRGYTRLANRIALNPDGSLLLSDESNGTVRLWETTSGTALRTLSLQTGESSALAFHPDGRFFVKSLPDKTLVLWEVSSGQRARLFQGHQGEVWAAIFSPDGRFLLSGSLDRTIKVWEVENGRCLTTLAGHDDWIWSLACSADGTLLASGALDGVIKLWNRESGQCLYTLRGSSSPIVALAFTSDGRELLSSNAQDLLCTWDVQSGDCLRVVPGIGETYWLGSVAFSADGALLATAGNDQTVKLWDVKSGTLLQRFLTPASRPWQVAFSADQRLLACGTDDGTILLWERQTGGCLRTLRGDRPYERMDITGATGLSEEQITSLKLLGARTR